MSTSPITPVAAPDLRAVLNALKVEIMAQLNCHQWGVVQSFDATRQTAKIVVSVLRQVPNPDSAQPGFVTKQYPFLLDVPVFFPQGGGGGLTMPVKNGDLALVHFNDRDIDTFWDTGTIALPNSPRLHDLSDSFAEVGYRTKANPLADYDPDQVVLFLGLTKVILGDKVGLENASTSLLTVLTNLITTLKAWVNTGGSTPNAGTITALTTIQSEISDLLQ